MNDLILSETFWRDLFIDIYPFLVYAPHLFYPHAQTSSRLVRQGSGFTLFPTFVRCEFSFKNHPRSVSHMAPRPSERSPQPHLMQGAKRLSPKFCKAVERRAGGSFKQIGKRTEIGSRITNKRNKKESGIDMWIGFFSGGTVALTRQLNSCGQDLKDWLFHTFVSLIGLPFATRLNWARKRALNRTNLTVVKPDALWSGIEDSCKAFSSGPRRSSNLLTWMNLTEVCDVWV